MFGHVRLGVIVTISGGGLLREMHDRLGTRNAMATQLKEPIVIILKRLAKLIQRIKEATQTAGNRHSGDSSHFVFFVRSRDVLYTLLKVTSCVAYAASGWLANFIVRRVGPCSVTFANYRCRG
ncbi:unnamed protein product [Toxocara canis]|uniref:Secreted protein n=1 Tax=Toxocara canis TaxID=6265 RepID=A0A183TWF9_TOXCA|nr:unnamed protein product [Toxocara canis]